MARTTIDRLIIHSPYEPRCLPAPPPGCPGRSARTDAEPAPSGIMRDDASPLCCRRTTTKARPPTWAMLLELLPGDGSTMGKQAALEALRRVTGVR